MMRVSSTIITIFFEEKLTLELLKTPSTEAEQYSIQSTVCDDNSSDYAFDDEFITLDCNCIRLLLPSNLKSSIWLLPL